ncbi:MAG TPA: DNA polymerase IV [Myxococcaceae bacterium]|nr:DNA polymerase IV [Myxococcaceae bacterium]
MRAILHVDMDAFYASVEQRDRPELRGQPVVVGGHPRRGVVLAASYEVRPFGVRSAIPMARALKLAPAAVVVSPRFAAYAEASEQVFAILERYTPLIEPLSLDEAFLDVTASQALFGTPAEIATRLRREIAAEVRLPASAGIASSKFVAKIASDLAKPDGQREVPPEKTREFLAALPVSRLWGVGPKLEERLHRLGLRLVGDLAIRDETWLAARLGDLGAHLAALARGEDDRPVIPDRSSKSIGAEDTFEEDVADLEVLRPRLHAQALRVGRRLRRAGLRTRVVQLKLKLDDFTLQTRRCTLDRPTDDGQELYRHALGLLERAPLPRPVRLTGVSAQELDEVGEAQLGLFGEPPRRSDALNRALDAIAERFGRGAVAPADVLSLEEGEPLDELRTQAGVSRLDLSGEPKRSPS